MNLIPQNVALKAQKKPLCHYFISMRQTKGKHFTMHTKNDGKKNTNQCSRNKENEHQPDV